MKRASVILTAAAMMACLLTGCGSRESSGSAGSKTDTAASAAESSAAAESEAPADSRADENSVSIKTVAEVLAESLNKKSSEEAEKYLLENLPLRGEPEDLIPQQDGMRAGYEKLFRFREGVRFDGTDSSNTLPFGVKLAFESYPTSEAAGGKTAAETYAQLVTQGDASADYYAEFSALFAALGQALGDTEITANNAASRFVSMNGTHTAKVGYFDQSSHYEKQVGQESGTKVYLFAVHIS